MLPYGPWTINSIFILAPLLRAKDRRRLSFYHPLKTLLTLTGRESRMNALLAYLTITCGHERPFQKWGTSRMSENDVIANQKHILQNQKSILANQNTIKANQETIKKNQASILKNQTTLNTIVQNQKKILAKLK